MLARTTLPSPHHDEDAERVSVLLVDDRPDALLTLEEILKDLGQNLVKARSGTEALRCVLAADFAVILLDVEMPIVDGYETAELIRARERSRHVPIIFLTAAYRTDEHVERGYALGAVDYVIKPIAPEILRSKVSVFVELAKKNQYITKQTAVLRESEARAVALARKSAALLDALRERNTELAQARDSAEQATRFKTQFLATMSHELRTPLNSVIGFAELLDEGVFGELNVKQRECTEAIVQGGRHLLSLLNDVLDLSRVEVGRLVISPTSIPPDAILEMAREVAQTPAMKRAIHLETRAEDGGGGAYADPVRLKQILYNLLSNAIKFTEPGGTVSVSVAPDGNGVAIVVEDTGIGIAAEDVPRLFHEFEQIAPKGGVKPEGTGLGLAVTRRLVEMQGGSVSVESTLGRGSTFRVVLPSGLIARVAPESDPSRAEDAAASQVVDAEAQ